MFLPQVTFWNCPCIQDRVEDNYEPPQQKHKEESLTTVLSINIFIDVEEKISTFHHIKY